MEKKYENLRQKTVFDFCDDPKILQQVFWDYGYTPEEKAVLKKICEESITDKAVSFEDLADITENEDLRKAVESEFKEILKDTILCLTNNKKGRLYFIACLMLSI